MVVVALALVLAIAIALPAAATIPAADRVGLDLELVALASPATQPLLPSAELPIAMPPPAHGPPVVDLEAAPDHHLRIALAVAVARLSACPQAENRIRGRAAAGSEQHQRNQHFSLGIAPGVCDGPSTYQGFANSPLNYSDPLGLEASVGRKGHIVITNPETGRSRVIRNEWAQKHPSGLWFALVEEADVSEEEAKELIAKAGVPLVPGFLPCAPGETCMSAGPKQRGTAYDVASRVAAVPVCGISGFYGAVERTIYGRGGDISCPISPPTNELQQDLDRGLTMLMMVPVGGKAAPYPVRLTTAEVRALYSAEVRSIDGSLALTRENAILVHNARNSLKRDARDMMLDRAGARQLDRDRPLRSFDYYEQKYRAEGLEGEALWERIIHAGRKPNVDVNRRYGVRD